MSEIKICQKPQGYRHSLDPILLVAFSSLAKMARIADLGTGSGVIPLLAARINPAAKIVGIEIQSDLADLAERNVRLNSLEGRIRILRQDLRAATGEEGRFDAVLTNPPYRRPGTGKIAPDGERAAARHELAGGLEDFLAAGARLLKPGGRFFIVFLAERLAELLAKMRAAGLEPKRLRCVHPRQGRPARMVLVEGRKGGREGVEVMAPLYVYQGSGRDYTPEVRAMYGEGRKTEGLDPESN